MGELGKEHDMGTLYGDSQSAIHLAKNSTLHSRTKTHTTQVPFHTISVGRWRVEAGKDTH